MERGVLPKRKERLAARWAALALLLSWPVCLQAQRLVLSGMVSDEKTGTPLSQATLTVRGSCVSVVTNDDGVFTLKADSIPNGISVSHLSYETKVIPVARSSGKPMNIRLKPTSILLQELVVWTGNPEELVNLAIKKIPLNYSLRPELFNCFYRETAMKRQHYIYVAEGVVDMYKTAYNRNNARDRVAIRKGRRLLSPRQRDTLGVKVMGGPVQPIQLDIVKNLDFLLNPQELALYSFKMESPEVIEGRMQYVVSIAPKTTTFYALNYGRLYIDQQTLAFTRAELSLDMSDREKATSTMLVKKPLGVRFRPKELSTLIDYRQENGVTRIGYIRSTFRFNCDWRRRLFATSFMARCEMVVTDRNSDADVQPISGRKSFDQRDAFYDRVEYFRDPRFWEDYNIIEPTESLDQAIHKLMRKYQ